MTDCAPESWLRGESLEADAERERPACVGRGTVVVAPGDCIHSIAVSHGVSWEEVWNHPDNAALRAARKSPGVLLPGDLVTVPPHAPVDPTVQTGTANRFKARVPTVRFAITLQRAGRPRGELSYSLGAESTTIEGTTDSEGRIDVRVPARARTATLTLHERDGVDEVLEVRFGSLDPWDTVTGAQGRLSNMGYYSGAIDGVVGPETRAAIERFRRQHGLAPSGELDADVRDRIQSAHGS